MSASIPPRLYAQLISIIEAQRVALGISIEELCDMAGVADRSISKWVKPECERPGEWVGRKLPKYESLDDVLQALFGGRYEVSVRAKAPPRRLPSRQEPRSRNGRRVVASRQMDLFAG